MTPTETSELQLTCDGVIRSSALLGIRSMTFAYADPPYLGLAKAYRKLHPNADDYDKPETHALLIQKLCAEYPDGWAMSLHSPSLRTILPMCPVDVRVMSWVKPFCSYKPNVRVAYAWEPIIIRGGRPRPKTKPTERDWLAESNIDKATGRLRGRFYGAKPEKLIHWILECLGAEICDQLDDLFPGSGNVGRAWETWKTNQRDRMPNDQAHLRQPDRDSRKETK